MYTSLQANLSKMRIGNYTNHSTRVYLNRKDYTIHRNGKRVLTNPFSHDWIEYSQNGLIHVQHKTDNVALPWLFKESMSFSGITQELMNFDIVIVSSVFANYIYKQVINQGIAMMSYDLLDRFFRPIPLHKDLTGSEKVGCVGFEKIFNPLWPRNYINSLQTGVKPYPSYAAMIVSIENAKNTNVNYRIKQDALELETILKYHY